MMKKILYILFIINMQCESEKFSNTELFSVLVGCNLAAQTIYDLFAIGIDKFLGSQKNNKMDDDSLIEFQDHKFKTPFNNKHPKNEKNNYYPAEPPIPKLNSTELYIANNQFNQKNIISWDQVHINQEIKDQILSFGQFFFDASRPANISIPEILLLYGLPGMDKSNILKGLGCALNIPVIIIDPILIPNDFQWNALIKYIEKKDSDCIIFLKDLEKFSSDKSLFLKMYQLLHYGIKNIIESKNRILITFSCNQDHIIHDLNLYQSIYTQLFIIQYPDLACRIKLIESIFHEYQDYIDISNIMISEIALLFKNLTNKDIKNIMHATLNSTLHNCNQYEKVLLKNHDILLEYKKYMQNCTIINNKENFINKGLLEFNLMLAEKSQISFTDVIGLDHIKKKLSLYINYLNNIELYKKLGIDLPHGILFIGKPGCGKTLLAKALASESNIPFIIVNGSDIIDKYVGSGASKIREIFDLAKSYGKAIIYIDEIDSIAVKKSDSTDGGEKEYTQTLNALLVEMDGFANNASNQIIVIGSTNRNLDHLEPAVLRRFEDKYYFDLPTFTDRENTIAYYTNHIRLAHDVSLKDLASKTIGYSSADIVTLIKNAKYFAIKKRPVNDETSEIFLTNEDFTDAYYENTIGYIIPHFQVSSEALRETAIHEIGHSLCQLYAENIFIKNDNRFIINHTALHRGEQQTKTSYAFELVTIEPRSISSGGTVLGFSSQIKLSEYSTLSNNELKDRIMICLGGYCAEKLFLGHTTDGVGSDLDKANRIAKHMILSGMTSSLFIGKGQELTKEQIEQTENLLQACLKECHAFLEDQSDLLLFLADKLLEKKIIYRREMLSLIDSYYQEIVNRNNQ